MQFKNGYKVLYELNEEGTRSLYASKILQQVEQKKCVAINVESGDEVNLRPFKLVYEDGKVFYGSTTGLPTDTDVKFTFKDVDGDMVLGDGYEGPVAPKYEVTVVEVENCVVTGAGQYKEGANVTITLEPAADYIFSASNKPQVDGVDMTEVDGKFTHTFVMGTEAKTITITGTAVEPKPIAREIFYTLAENNQEPISGTWYWTESKGKAKVKVVTKRPVGQGDTDVHQVFAVNKDMHPQGFLHIQDAMFNNTEYQYNVSEEQYAGATYVKYVFKDIVVSDGITTWLVLSEE